MLSVKLATVTYLKGSGLSGLLQMSLIADPVADNTQ